MKREFIRTELEFHLPQLFKGLSKEYMLKCIFDEEIQQNWTPQIGDIIIGSTGNVFVISGKSNLHEDLGGPLYFFGGLLCGDDEGFLCDTLSFTANESGRWYHPYRGEEMNLYHSSIREFKYVPYPHEIEKF